MNIMHNHKSLGISWLLLQNKNLIPKNYSLDTELRPKKTKNK